MKTMNRWGPWALDLEPGERLARLRSLRALARVLAGPRAVELCQLLHQAETNPVTLVPAADALDRLPSVDMRRIVGSYAGLVRPVPPARAARPGVKARRLTNPWAAANSTWQAAA